jgi:hypothetical protein
MFKIKACNCHQIKKEKNYVEIPFKNEFNQKNTNQINQEKIDNEIRIKNKIKQQQEENSNDKLFNNEKKSDLVITFYSGNTLFLIKSILTKRSKVFERLFYNHRFQIKKENYCNELEEDNGDNKKEEIQFNEEVEENTFTAMVYFIYTNKLVYSSNETLYDLLFILFKYEVDIKTVIDKLFKNDTNENEKMVEDLIKWADDGVKVKDLFMNENIDENGRKCRRLFLFYFFDNVSLGTFSKGFLKKVFKEYILLKECNSFLVRYINKLIQ